MSNPINPLNALDQIIEGVRLMGESLTPSLREIVAQTEALDPDTQQRVALVVRPLLTALRQELDLVAAPLREAEASLSAMALEN